eukprot:1875097-Amphidinium_carterae.1
MAVVLGGTSPVSKPAETSCSPDACLERAECLLQHMTDLLGEPSSLEPISSWRSRIWQELGEGDASAGAPRMSQIGQRGGE